MVSQYDMMLVDTSMHMDGLPSLGPGSRVSAGALLWWEGGGRAKMARTRKRTAMNPNDRPARKKAFIEELRQRYSVYHACKAAGIGRTTVYAWRQDDAEFAKAWDAALADAADVLEASAYQRALEGDTTLTIFLLKGAFQPTHPHGVRRCVKAISYLSFQVSTHAPARGATLNWG